VRFSPLEVFVTAGTSHEHTFGAGNERAEGGVDGRWLGGGGGQRPARRLFQPGVKPPSHRSQLSRRNDGEHRLQRQVLTGARIGDSAHGIWVWHLVAVSHKNYHYKFSVRAALRVPQRIAFIKRSPQKKHFFDPMSKG